MGKRRNSRPWYRSTTFRLSVVAIVIILLVCFRLAEDIGRERSPGDRFIVTKVVDGDTVVLSSGDKLRLLAIDTPEKDAPYYNEATSFLASMVLGKPVEIRYGDTRRDKYGRLLGFVYVDDSVFVNKAIIDNGLAYLYLFKDNELDQPLIEDMLRSQRAALASGIGIWSLERAPESHYIRSTGSFRFHRPGCRSVADIRPGDRQNFQTREEALILGLSPCRNCQP